MARRSFSKGIFNVKIRNRLITRGASSLEDAIAYAIEAENDDLNYIPKKELYCTKCNQNGHRKRECRNNNSEMNTLISTLRSFVNRNWNSQIQNDHNQPYFGRNFNTNQNSNYFKRNRNDSMPSRNSNRNNFISNWNPNCNRNPNDYNSERF